MNEHTSKKSKGPGGACVRRRGACAMAQWHNGQSKPDLRYSGRPSGRAIFVRVPSLKVTNILTNSVTYFQLQIPLLVGFYTAVKVQRFPIIDSKISSKNANGFATYALPGRDVNKDWTCTDKDKDKDKDQAYKNQDKDKDLNLVLKESLRTRTRTSLTASCS